jgi:hypothetical protein
MVSNNPISDFAALSTPVLTDDVFPIVDDVGGTPTTKKITAKNLLVGSSDVVPACVATVGSNFTLATSTDLNGISFNSEDFDTDGIHDNVTNNERLTCQTAGKYFIFAIISFSSNGTGYRRLALRMNAGGTYIAYQQNDAPAAYRHSLCVKAIKNLVATDYLYLYTRQNSGSTLTISGGVDYSGLFGMVRIGD